MKIWLAILPLLFSSPSVQAALKWERLRVELAPGLNERAVEARFAFVNEGQAAVTIESLASSCGCTTATLSQKSWQPGEKGEVLARFEIGQRRGLQTKTVTVKIQVLSVTPSAS